MKVLTRAVVEQMDEDEFVKEIIVPILKGKGWGEVDIWHGRQELGKDVVAWRENPELGYLETVAVVTKAVRPTSSRDISAIQIQISQALNRTFRARSSQREMEVDDVWVVVNKPLPKETRENIAAGITIPRGRLLIFDLDQCWTLAEPYVLSSKRDVLQLSQDVLKGFETPYDLQLVTSDNVQQLIVREKYPGQASETPLTGRVVFNFENEEHKQAFSDYWKRIEETGEMEVLPKGIRARIETDGLDAITAELFGASSDMTSLVMSTAENSERKRFSFRIDPVDAPAVEIPYVEMRIAARGTKQTRMVNDEQDLPIQLELIIRHSGDFTLNVSFQLGEVSATWVNRGITFLNAMTRQSEFSITNVDTGMRVHHTCVLTPKIKVGWSPEFAEAARVLAAVEERAGKVVIIPDRGISDKEANVLSVLKGVVDGGVVEYTPTGYDLAFSVNRTVLDDLLQEVKVAARGGAFRLARDEEIDIFGTTIRLGRSATSLPPATLTNENEIRIQVKNAPTDEDLAVGFNFKPIEGSVIRKSFVDWQDQRPLI